MQTATSDLIAVVGLGYVGLPLAVALARNANVIGVDIDAGRIAELRRGHDRTREIDADVLSASTLVLATDIAAARDAGVFIVTVPTPVDAANLPDLGSVLGATRAVASLLRAGAGTIVVYESTVYPGVTEEICGPELERLSGLIAGVDFHLGYSPERINPGDREHTLDRITKVVAGSTPAVTDRLVALYGTINGGNVFRAASIKVAEAAKVIENAQRDINIAFVNEITQIFGRIDVSIHDVLAAAGTKWNFLRFEPGLVGGHCIGVDPYYLAHLAARTGFNPRVVLAGRATNDNMGAFVADELHTRMTRAGRVLVLGLTFKADVPDLRNSKVVDVVRRLEWLGHGVTIHDPMADAAEAMHEYGLILDTAALDTAALLAVDPFDAVLLAVPHASYRDFAAATVRGMVRPGGVVADIKGVWRDRDLAGLTYWAM